MLCWAPLREHVGKPVAIKRDEGSVVQHGQQEADQHDENVVDAGVSASLKADPRLEIAFVP